jgi:hypothetical protein
MFRSTIDNIYVSSTYEVIYTSDVIGVSMKRILMPFLLVLLLTILGCDDSSTNPNNNPTPPIDEVIPRSELPGTFPIGIDSTTLFIPADGGGRNITIYNNTDHSFSWGSRLNPSSATNWIYFYVTHEVIEPGRNSATGVMINRDDLSQGTYHSEVMINFDGEEIHTIDVTVEVGPVDAVPIGVNTNTERIAAHLDHALIIGYNNLYEDIAVDDQRFSWSSPTTWIDDVVFPVLLTLRAGDSGACSVYVDRTGLTPGTHTGQLHLFWQYQLAQTITLEMEVEE